jgi:hypothetical protein
MSRDNIADELDAVTRNRRKYAAFFDWPDKAVKEWDVVCELLNSMHANGDCRYTRVEAVDNDWPDCVIRDSGGVQVGVEVTEFVDQKAVEMCERGKNVYREWSDQAVREKIAQILISKNGKAYHDDLYGKLILVIHNDEVDLPSFRLFPILAASHLPRPRNIRRGVSHLLIRAEARQLPESISVHKAELGWSNHRIPLAGRAAAGLPSERSGGIVR